ncbi:ABC transporter ATP-binding protein/permease [Yinghuangia sp. ASG 101]|uniref:ABC transporter ATP-binding protein n=1 Tax=Yinghuangia sp. ASG 101 TaxID=2896848 RepID=UPI001E2B06F3|nr:ABC transporter ATP-binding protein [Yinghuangia sp. ASG 101]UGQ12379.1 ABC transporter ATP-binding protein/permease [Yinghuangia sp. ASG 101]
MTTLLRRLAAALGPRHTRPLRTLVAAALAAAVLQGLCFALLVPVLRRLLGPDPGGAAPWLWAFGATATAYAVAQAAAIVLGFTAGARVSLALHQRLADHVATLPLGWFTRARSAELGRLAGRDVIQVMNVPAHLIRPLSTAVVTPVTIVAATWLFDPVVALVLTLGLGALAAAYAASGAVVRRLDLGRDRVIAESAARIVEYAQNQPVLRAFGRTAEGHRALDDALTAEARADRRMINRGVPGLVAFAFTVRALFTAALITCAALLIGGDIDAPLCLALVVLTARLAEAVQAAGDLGASVRPAANALARLTAVLATDPLPEPARPHEPADTTVEFENVHFAYGDRDVLRGVSLRLPAHGLTALVGPSGAGKTTLTRLLARFWDADAGRVLIGGTDVRDIAAPTLRATVSTVFHDAYLFEGTLMDNIRVGDPAADRERAHRAAESAGLADVAASLPQGWDTPVGEGGATLSGGQRQRVALARALLADTPILILDEPTAALDSASESDLVALLRHLSADHSVLVVSHRPDTVRAADRVLVLDDGRVTETGTHDELLEHPGTYARFFAAPHPSAASPRP